MIPAPLIIGSVENEIAFLDSIVASLIRGKGFSLRFSTDRPGELKSLPDKDSGEAPRIIAAINGVFSAIASLLQAHGFQMKPSTALYRHDHYRSSEGAAHPITLDWHTDHKPFVIVTSGPVNLEYVEGALNFDPYSCSMADVPRLTELSLAAESGQLRELPNGSVAVLNRDVVHRRGASKYDGHRHFFHCFIEETK